MVVHGKSQIFTTNSPNLLLNFIPVQLMIHQIFMAHDLIYDPGGSGLSTVKFQTEKTSTVYKIYEY